MARPKQEYEGRWLWVATRHLRREDEGFRRCCGVSLATIRGRRSVKDAGGGRGDMHGEESGDGRLEDVVARLRLLMNVLWYNLLASKNIMHCRICHEFVSTLFSLDFYSLGIIL